MEIYFIGLVVLLVLELIALVVTEDKDCNISKVVCFISALVLSLTSWVGLIFLFLVEVRRYWFEK